MGTNDLINERFGNNPVRMKGEIPYLLAVRSIMKRDQKIAERAERIEKIKSFFRKVRTKLWPE